MEEFGFAVLYDETSIDEDFEHNIIATKEKECHDLAKRLSHYLYFFSFLFFFFFFGLTTTRWSVGKYHVTLSQCHIGDGWSRMSCHKSQSQGVT